MDIARKISLPLWLGLTSVLVLASISGFELYKDYEHALELSEHTAMRRAEVLEEHIRSSLVTFDNILLRAAHSAQLVRSGSVEGRSLNFYRRDGAAQSRPDPMLPVAAQEHPFFSQHVLEDRGMFVGHSGGPSDGEPMLVLSRRISDEDGAFMGVVALSLGRSFFERFLRVLQTGPHDIVAIFSLDGTGPFRPPEREGLQAAQFSVAPGCAEARPAPTIRGLKMTAMLGSWRSGPWPA